MTTQEIATAIKERREFKTEFVLTRSQADRIRKVCRESGLQKFNAGMERGQVWTQFSDGPMPAEIGLKRYRVYVERSMVDSPYRVQAIQD